MIIIWIDCQQRWVGTGDPPEQNADRPERDPRPRLLILPLVQAAGECVLRDTLKRVPASA